MPDPTTSATDAAPAAVEDQPIRERVKELTSQVLQQGRVDPEAVRDVVSTVLGRTPGTTFVSGAKARELFADAVRQLDGARRKRPCSNACQWRIGRHSGCTARPYRDEEGQIATDGLRVVQHGPRTAARARDQHGLRAAWARRPRASRWHRYAARARRTCIALGGSHRNRAS